MRGLALFLLVVGLARAAVLPAQVENVRSLLRDGKVGAAGSAVHALIGANPEDAEAYVLLAAVNVARDEADAAVEAGEKAVELAPANSDYQRRLGDTYGFAAQKAGMFGKMTFAKKCRLAYEKAVELDPKNVAARNSLMSFYQMAPGIAGGGMDKAYAQAAEIKQLDAIRGHLAYAALYGADKKTDLALAELDEVFKAAPDDYAALYQLGKLAATSGQVLDRGLAALRRCLALSAPAGAPGHAAAQWRIGNILEKQNDPAGARTAYQTALKLDPKFTQAAESLKKLP